MDDFEKRLEEALPCNRYQCDEARQTHSTACAAYYRDAVLAAHEQATEALRALVQTMINEDPNDMAADGVTVLDVWRKEAKRALTQDEPCKTCEPPNGDGQGERIRCTVGGMSWTEPCPDCTERGSDERS